MELTKDVRVLNLKFLYDSSKISKEELIKQTIKAFKEDAVSIYEMDG